MVWGGRRRWRKRRVAPHPSQQLQASGAGADARWRSLCSPGLPQGCRGGRSGALPGLTTQHFSHKTWNIFVRALPGSNATQRAVPFASQTHSRIPYPRTDVQTTPQTPNPGCTHCPIWQKRTRFDIYGSQIQLPIQTFFSAVRFFSSVGTPLTF